MFRVTAFEGEPVETDEVHGACPAAGMACCSASPLAHAAWRERPALMLRLAAPSLGLHRPSPPPRLCCLQMAPAWFDPAEVPFDKMWADDVYW